MFSGKRTCGWMKWSVARSVENLIPGAVGGWGGVRDAPSEQTASETTRMRAVA
jgi:hypothetical protein